MITRVRLIYEKRGGACFVPHIALATLFTRAANRAGIELRSTEGFSPHAKMSFGPELPAGVVALCEPVDVWVRELQENLLSVWNAQMPDGFRIKRCVLLPADAPVLGKNCKAAHYLIWSRNEYPAEELLQSLRSHYSGEDVLDIKIDDDSRVSFIVADPARNGIGGWVKSLIASERVAGWQDLCIVRTALGRWNGVQMEPLSTEEGIVCLQTEK